MNYSENDFPILVSCEGDFFLYHDPYSLDKARKYASEATLDWKEMKAADAFRYKEFRADIIRKNANIAIVRVKIANAIIALARNVG